MIYEDRIVPSTLLLISGYPNTNIKGPLKVAEATSNKTCQQDKRRSN